MKKNTPTCENCPNAARCPLLKIDFDFRKMYCDRLISTQDKVSRPSSNVTYLKCFIDDENFDALSRYRIEPFGRWWTDLRNSFPLHDN